MITITNVHRGTSIWGIPGWFASVNAKVGATESSMSVSRLDGEQDWLVDSLFGPGCYPFFAHGEGDRTVAKQRLNPESEAVAELNRQAGLSMVNEGVQMALWPEASRG